MTLQNTKQLKIISSWLYVGLILVILMVVIGGVTRVTNSGLSMVDWRFISDMKPPLNESEWVNIFERYKQFPEYQKINNSMELTDFKRIFFWEYTHRLLGRIIGLIFIIPFLFFLAKRWLKNNLKKRLLKLLILGSLQGFLGWFMVKSGLIDTPKVSHFRLAMHLGVAYLIIGYIYWIILNISKQQKICNSTINHLLKLFVYILTIQIIYGAFVAGTDAGFLKSSHEINTIYGYFNPDNMRDFNLLSNPYNIQFIHRTLGWFIAIFGILIFIKTKKTKYQKTGSVIFFLIILQVTLGVISILYSMPNTIRILHQFIPIIILLLSLNIIYLSSQNSQ
ncbi:MAG: COX15/CtaA family protein [Bacteroidota bacterium]|nr:COX15/CtaA family protein [Bacteroidota bacterium]